MGCRAARDLQSGIVEAKSSTAKADTSGTGFGVSPVTVADFTVQCLLLGALAQRFPNERSTVPLAILAAAGPATFRLEALSRLRTAAPSASKAELRPLGPRSAALGVPLRGAGRVAGSRGVLGPAGP
mgnify:CR=1 FL=1